jgi:hypothetical protein
MAYKKFKYIKLFLILAFIFFIGIYLFSLQNKEGFADFKDENGKVIDIANVENEEQRQAEKYIEPDSIVLELGARYGTVSSMINKKLNVKTNQVSVEPDSNVIKALKSNKSAQNDKYYVLQGFISRKKLELTGQGYGLTAKETDSTSYNSYTLEDVEKIYNLKFNTLVADCEGCLETFFDENPRLYKDLRLVIFEKDYPDKCNYDKVIENLKKNNYKELVSGFHSVWKK